MATVQRTSHSALVESAKRLDPRVEAALTIADECKGTMSVRELADHVHLSISRFAHLFKSQVRISPARFLRSLRMDNATILVMTTSLPVKQIAADAGFADSGRFQRLFRQIHGYSPTNARKSGLNDDLQRQ